jgi:RNA polymerase sigma-70 factor (ECF subfamily)
MRKIAAMQICYSWNGLSPTGSGEHSLEQHSAMNGFLQDVERRALRVAEFSVGNREDALELVQEAMLGLVRHYAQRPSDEWRPLFYRILQSRINDFHRRRAVRRRVMSFMPGAEPADGEVDPIDRASSGERDNPATALEQGIANRAMLDAIANLPARQQQAFVLRAWEGMPVRDTAVAMSCSEGSVKTHYNRALKALREALAEHKPHDIN